jgi:putative membrane protein
MKGNLCNEKKLISRKKRFGKLGFTGILGLPFIFLDVGDFHHMDHMMDWWGIPYVGFWWIVVWIIQFIIAFLIYKDAEKQGKNSVLWFVLVILPLVGIPFLIAYLIVRSEEADTKEAINDALNILDERYAKGEITREEYQKIKKDITKENE